MPPEDAQAKRRFSADRAEAAGRIPDVSPRKRAHDPGAEALEELLGGEGKALTIGQVGEVTERERVADILVRFVAQSPEATDTGWLDEIRRSGVPVYGTRAGSGDEIVEMDSAGSTRPVGVETVRS